MIDLSKENSVIAYRYINFRKMPNYGRKTSVWWCLNNNSGDSIGVVKWHGPWRQYCYWSTANDAVYSAGCLDDIKDFIAKLMKQRAEARGE